MTKLALVCALICAGQIYGMEPQPSYETLPKDLKQEIINTALATSKNVDEAIKRLSALHGVHYDNLKAFTALVNVLAKKFNLSTYDVAEKFNSPIATQYLELGSKITNRALMNAPYITLLIKKGADVNFSQLYVDMIWDNDIIKHFVKTPLMVAIDDLNIEAVKALLDADANQNLPYPLKGTALDYLHHAKRVDVGIAMDDPTIQKEKSDKIEQLLKEAMKK